MRDQPAALIEQSRVWGVELEGNCLETPRGVVGFGRRGAEAVVLKVPGALSDEQAGAAALAHFGSERAVRLLARAGNGAILLESALPATPLSQLVLDGADGEATQILCDVMLAIHKRALPAGQFPSVERWGEGFARYVASGDATLPSTLVSKAGALFEELCRTQSDRRLLHGDLHHDNVVWDSRRGWLLIDPKGVIGEPAYEVGCVLRNPTGDPRWFGDRGVIEHRLAAFSQRLGFERSRMIAWAFSQAVLSAIWSVEGGEDPRRWLAAAAAFEPLLA